MAFSRPVSPTSDRLASQQELEAHLKHVELLAQTPAAVAIPGIVQRILPQSPVGSRPADPRIVHVVDLYKQLVKLNAEQTSRIEAHSTVQGIRTEGVADQLRAEIARLEENLRRLPSPSVASEQAVAIELLQENIAVVGDNTAHLKRGKQNLEQRVSILQDALVTALHENIYLRNRVKRLEDAVFPQKSPEISKEFRIRLDGRASPARPMPWLFDKDLIGEVEKLNEENFSPVDTSSCNTSFYPSPIRWFLPSPGIVAPAAAAVPPSPPELYSPQTYENKLAEQRAMYRTIQLVVSPGQHVRLRDAKNPSSWPNPGDRVIEFEAASQSSSPGLNSLESSPESRGVSANSESKGS